MQNKMNKLMPFGIMRLLRIVFGVVAIIQSFFVHDVILAILGLIVAGMAIFNMGCCATNNCNTNYNNKTNNPNQIEYEEVVSEK